MTLIRDAGVGSLQAQATSGRCTFHVEADDAAALSRQQSLLQSVSAIACGGPATTRPSQGAAGFDLQMPARCPLSSSTPLIAREGGWHQRRLSSVPAYPAAAMREAQQGGVELMLLLDAQGKTQAIILSRSSGYPLLDAAALKHARDWRYEREAAGKAPNMSLIRGTVTFKLN
ncbi:energy transducer TonB [Stenotrophomonas maltophilia]|uniref:energy transducer TonB n=1 Tax=Stenotrophomonas geniculata TaxID=86188 RepID=UPI0018D41E03|nr:energy transducer TonB [Stenotrophomonas geniculata]MBH1460052.1 energy transducer TonB [Stenotrophomonas maltophilia]MBH1801571.1 energy transducer TonB [Stenotrophomonas maltophilia]